MKTLMRTAVAAFCLFPAQAATAEKTAGKITVLGDAAEFSSGSLGLAGGLFSLDGAIPGVAHGVSAPAVKELESGFYSRLVSSPAAPSYASVSTFSYALGWIGNDPPGTNPAGTIYHIALSTWAQADPYMVYYTTGADGYPVEGLLPNASYYNFIFSDYMDGDYSPLSSTAAATLAAVPPSELLNFAEAGHNSVAVAFTAFENTPPYTAAPWAEPPGVALPDAGYGQASVVYASHVFVSGGFNGVYFSSAVYRAPLQPGGGVGAFVRAGYLPAARYGHQLAGVRGRLYVLGGYDPSGSHAEVWSADVSSAGVLGAWTAETPLPDPVYMHAAAVAGGRIFVSGGYRSGTGVLSAVYYNQPQPDGSLQGTWTASDPLPEPRYGHTLTTAGGRRLYAVGGRDGSSARADVYGAELAPASGLPGGWTPAVSLPAPRYGHRTLSAGGRLYVVGGNGGSGAQRAVFQARLNPGPADPIYWEAFAQLPEARQLHAAELAGDRLCVFGGSDGTAASGRVFEAAVYGTEYLVQVSSDPAFRADVRSSGWVSAPDMDFSGLLPTTRYYTRAKARNWTGIETAYSGAVSTLTYAAIPATAPWAGVWVDSAAAVWDANGNPAGYDYELQISSNPDFSGSGSSFTPATSLTLNGLEQSTTYYARVRVHNALGRRSRFAELPPIRTSFNPALDVDSPTVTSNQADFAAWQGTNTFLCDVDLDDVGVSGLSYFRVRVSTNDLDIEGSVVAPWTTVASGINQDKYLADWRLPQTLWESMPEGASNYISVRAYDNSGNYAELHDAFSLVKDSTPPQIALAYAPADVWYTDYPGDVGGLAFSDPLSGLERVQYSVSVLKGFADGGVIAWTDLPGLAQGATGYTATLAYSFNALANAASNYFSFRAIDIAGSTRTLTDAFGIGKLVSGPMVSIATPTAACLSTFTLVSGYTAETNAHAVLGTEVYLQDMSTLLYYNGGAFLSGSKAWHDAEDIASTYTVVFAGLPLASGRQYRAVARSSDSAGDYSQLLATYTFTYDSLPPTAAVLVPADGGAAYSPVSVSGTAGDATSGITAVDVMLKRVSDGKWWVNSLSQWSAGGEPLQAGTTPYWTWSFNNYLRDSLDSGASYYVTVRAKDNSTPANAGAFGVSGSTFAYYDATPPPATLLTAAKGAFSGAVALAWRSAGDNGSSGYLLSGAYKIAFSTYSGAAVSTATAQVTITTASVTAGTTQYRTLIGLSASASYYLTLWTADDALNWSPPSNEAVAAAGDPGTGFLTGNVSDASTQPVTGVLVQGVGPSGAVEGSDYTDAYGNYAIPGMNSLYLTVRAVWAADDIESSVSKSNVPNGSAGVNFRLSLAYQLASIEGTIPAGYLPSAVRRSSAPRYTTRALSAAAGAEPFVEVYRKGRRIGAAVAGGDGAFSVPNLLPGVYGLRVFNGTAYSRMENVTLRPGERLVFTPKYDLVEKDTVFAYPNPANTAVNFHFVTPLSAGSFAAEVEVFDIAGRLVKRLSSVTDDTVAAGGTGRKIHWDLSREKVASGVYIYILRIKNLSDGTTARVAKKFAVIR